MEAREGHVVVWFKLRMHSQADCLRVVLVSKVSIKTNS